MNNLKKFTLAFVMLTFILAGAKALQVKKELSVYSADQKRTEWVKAQMELNRQNNDIEMVKEDGER